MNFNKFKLTEWIWVSYPLFVVAFIIISLNFLLGTGPMSLMTVMSSQDQTNEENAKLVQLRTKLEVLNKVNKEIEATRLQKLLSAVPSGKKIWFLLEAINRSASQSALIINQYGGNIGDVKEASESAALPAVKAEGTPTPAASNNTMSLKIDMRGAPFDNLTRELTALENFLPLIKITDVSYSTTAITISVEGAWGPFVKSVSDNTAPLPDYNVTVNRALNGIRDRSDLTAESL
jgi:hypothetical protein